MDFNSFKQQLLTKTGSSRENLIKQAIDSGLVPTFPMKPIRVGGTLTFFVSTDYFSIGTVDNYVRMPCSPLTLSDFMERNQFSLPTKKMVDLIFQNSDIKIPAKSFRAPSGKSMTDSSLYLESNSWIESRLPTDHFYKLKAGHKKDVVLTDRLIYEKTHNKKRDNVAIYGWWTGSGTKMIKGLNPVDHSVTYVDYSHGLRMISNECILHETRGIEKKITLQKVFDDDTLSRLVHDEPLRFKKYGTQ